MNGIFKKDIVHEKIGDLFLSHNDLGDLLLIGNFFLLLFTFLLTSIDLQLVYRVIIIYISLMIIREMLVWVTHCECTADPIDRPLFSQDTTWYIISGHLLTSMTITFLIVMSETKLFIQVFSILISFCLFWIQILTREHMTCDMILTVVIFYLAFFQNPVYT